MSSNAAEILSQAAQAVRDGRFGEAIELTASAIALDPSNPQGYTLRGIALAGSGRLGDATAPLRRAAELAPNNAKARFNLALNLFERQLTKEAAEEARAALAADPEHLEARRLLSRIDPSIPFEVPAGETVHAPEVRPGYVESGEIHRLGFIDRWSKPWDWIGWGLTLVSAVFFLYLFLGPKPKDITIEGLKNMWSAQGFALAIFVRLLTAVAGLVWMIFDIVDRKSSALWLLPLGVCCCLGGSHWPILALYLLTGRKSPVSA